MSRGRNKDTFTAEGRPSLRFYAQTERNGAPPLPLSAARFPRHRFSMRNIRPGHTYTCLLCDPPVETDTAGFIPHFTTHHPELTMRTEDGDHGILMRRDLRSAKDSPEWYDNLYSLSIPGGLEIGLHRIVGIRDADDPMRG